MGGGRAWRGRVLRWGVKREVKRDGSRKRGWMQSHSRDSGNGMFLYILLIFSHWGPCVRAGLEGIWAGICINTLYIITLNEYMYVYVKIRTLVIFKSKLLQWQIEPGLREGFVHRTSLDIPSQLLQLKARPGTCKRQPGNLRFRLQAASVR